MFVLTLGHGVYGFTLDPSVGEFILSNEAIQCPQEGKIYAFNEGNYQVGPVGKALMLDLTLCCQGAHAAAWLACPLQC